MRDPDRAREQGRRWWWGQHERNLEMMRRSRAKRPRYHAWATLVKKGRLRGLSGTCRLEELNARFDVFGGRCWQCGEPGVVVDHVKPIGSGGGNWPCNLRPSCDLCNRRKKDKWPYPIETRWGSERPLEKLVAAGG
jgi:5-methylcytosine-specific restriction endonuclease McrA